MNWRSYFKELEIAYRIEINQELRDTIKEHFGTNLNVYTDQDLYEQTRRIIQNYVYRNPKKPKYE